VNLGVRKLSEISDAELERIIATLRVAEDTPGAGSDR
jgi:hypothetical protein